MAAYPDAIKVVVKSRPLETRSDSRLAYQAALAAAAQGKFWPMHDAIVAEPPGALTRDRLVELAVRADVVAARFLKDLDGPAVKDRLEADLEEARRRDIRGTPVFFINGTRIDGIQPLSSFTRRRNIWNPDTLIDVNAIMSPCGATAMVVPASTSLTRTLGGRSRLARITGDATTAGSGLSASHPVTAASAATRTHGANCRTRETRGAATGWYAVVVVTLPLPWSASDRSTPGMARPTSRSAWQPSHRSASRSVAWRAAAPTCARRCSATIRAYRWSSSTTR